MRTLCLVDRTIFDCAQIKKFGKDRAAGADHGAGGLHEGEEERQRIHCCLRAWSSARYFFITSNEAFGSRSPPLLRFSISSPIFLKSCGSFATSPDICSRWLSGKCRNFQFAYFFMRNPKSDMAMRDGAVRGGRVPSW